ncbi:uncharacterized protein [Choristoneura fumiferana]|uniref:uncharacterized protein n=1 Tax=Choristoneura fumiferana TaxID=7141 RepID=UPI003D15BE9F
MLQLKDCPYEEIHKSCMFFEEYTCWEDKDRLKRNKAPAKSLLHCWGGCVCSTFKIKFIKGLVRAYKNGPCVAAHTCRDLRLIESIKKVPVNFVRY